jgi:N,N-dimethylformamidase
MSTDRALLSQAPSRELRPDPALAAEFRATPLGHHSDGLSRLLRVLRSEPLDGKHVVVCVQPFREYRLGRLSARRGTPVDLIPGLVFSSPAAAEWAVFVRRWERHFGQPMDLDAVDRAAGPGQHA